jgi:Fe-S-cluster-containing dehydrogenase component
MPPLDGPATREELLAERCAALDQRLAQQRDPVTRRRFLELLGASLALAGAASCAPPREQIVPYVRQPENVVPGKPLYFASAHVLDGFAHGILIETHTGRPTKIEGNPQHPASLGATDVYTQASILALYDPNRSQTVTYQGQISTWTDFLRALRAQIAQLRQTQGDGLRFLTSDVTSPTLSAQFQAILSSFPRAHWHRWQPFLRDNIRQGAALAFGQPVEPRYRFDAADVILSLDADPFAWSPGRVRYMHDFGLRRRPEQGPLTRVYAVESTPTLMGAGADHRLPLRASEIEPFAFALAAALNVDSGGAPVAVPQLPDGWLQGLVGDLRAHAPRVLVVPGDFQSPAVHALAHAINQALGSVGTTLDYSMPVDTDPQDHLTSLRQLVDDMNSGQVSTLIMMGTNPAFTAPADMPFIDSLRNVGMRIHLGLFDDESAAVSHWHIPELHPLEDWSDARAYDGTVTILQPAIAPLYDAHSAHEVLATFTPQTGSSSHDIVRSYWQSQHTTGDFESFWRTSLHDGVVSGSALPSTAVSVRPGWAASTGPSAAPDEEFELVFRPDASLYDGRFANNSWLLELPRPLTKLTWDNVALVSPATARRLGVANEDVVELQHAGRTLRAPVWVLPGQADGSVALTLGYGRRRGAGAGQDIGYDAYSVRTSDEPWLARNVQIVRTGQTYALASTQGHYSMEGRELVVTAPAEGAALPQQQPLITLYPGYDYADNRWGMVIDLNSCVGCNACIVACQSENNIPSVGKEEVRRGRDMLWLRVDTYFQGDEANPDIRQQLVPCMQCENAPCELVCPVGATVHSSEGLNDMVYNRCVGTRYCSNNCPYKVRHFNFFQYSDFDTPQLKLLRNPEVTVRSRGVMEKCSYCIQRITAARVQAEKEDRPIRDGEVLTACQAACPSGSIIFGNLNDSGSEVSRQRSLPRNYTLLAELNTRPRTTYLAKVPNRNASVGNT